MKVGDIVRWTLPTSLTTGKASPEIGIVVKMHIVIAADVAWFSDDMRVKWTRLAELEVISES